MDLNKIPTIYLTLVIYGTLSILVFLAFYYADQELIFKTYQIYYLLAAVVIWCVGFMICGGRFIRPKWKQSGKLIFYLIVTTLLLAWVGHYAIFFIIGHQMIGWATHYAICKKHNINWLTCEPQDKYLALMEKWSRGDFK